MTTKTDSITLATMDLSSTERTNKNHGYGFTTTEHNDTYSAIDPLNLPTSTKSILVTGAARGIGREIALSYAKAGVSRLALLDVLELDELVEEVKITAMEAGRPEPEIIQSLCDITSYEQVFRVASSIQQAWKALDILINNAGYLDGFKVLGDSDPDKWWKNFEVNVKGVYNMTRCFLGLLLESREKTVIVLSSVGAHHTLPGGSGYETTKLAVLKINSYLMAEYGAQGLIAYAVAPGGVKTHMADGFPQQFHHLLSDSPQMAADTITFLTSERRPWLGGRYVDSRWDMTELLEKRDKIVEQDLLKVKLLI